MTVESPSAAYKAMEERRQLPRTLMGGTHAMRDAQLMYLPQEPAESDKAYRNRLNRTTLTNFYRRTVNTITGKVFSKPVVLNEDVPARIQEWAEDIDLAGNHLNIFAREVFKDALADSGLAFILVDMPRNMPNATLADEQRENIRPYWVHIKARQVIGWKSAVVNGREKLMQLRFKQVVTRTDPEDEFNEVEVEQIKVLEPGRFRVFELITEGSVSEWRVVDEGETSLDEIPLAVGYLDKHGLLCALPPLEDLAYLNLAHWQSSSDQRNILHVARVPILFGKGFAEETNVAVGPNTMIKAPSDADLKFVEHSGKGIDAGRQDLQDLEDAMRIFGLEIQLPRTGTTTATGKAIDAADAHSLVQSWALALGDCIEQALMFTAQWVKEQQGGSVKVNTDFGISLRDATDVDALLKARQAREISRETFWAELRRRGVLVDDFDAEGEADLLDAEGPALGEMTDGVDQRQAA